MALRRRTCAYFAFLGIAMTLGSDALAEPVWIDVRSVEEHAEDRIEGDLNLPHEAIVEQVRERFPDTAAELRLYCGSGRRAGMAMDALREAEARAVTSSQECTRRKQLRGLRESLPV